MPKRLLQGRVVSKYDDTAQDWTWVSVDHVCIVESPAIGDIEDDRQEGVALSQSLSLAQISNQLWTVSSRDSFREAFRLIAGFASPRELEPPEPIPGRFASQPKLYLHISCHGNEAGLGLTNGDFIEWHELREMLLELGNALHLHIPGFAPACMIGLSMSSCFGLHARKMAFDTSVCPFFYLIGAERSVRWTDSLTAFV